MYLVVSAVGAGDELAVDAESREPRLNVVLLGGGVVEGARDDGNNAVGDLERLDEVLGSGDHLVESGPGLLGVAEDELLDLLELVDTEHAPRVLAVRAGLLAEARGDAGVEARQILALEPLTAVQRRDGLLGSGDEVHVAGLGLAADLVELLVKLLELRRGRHRLLLHEVRGLEGRVGAAAEERQAVLDQSLQVKSKG